MSDEDNSVCKDNKKLYSLYFQEYTILGEYQMLESESIPGIYVIPSYESSFLWFGVIFVRTGCYEGGVFRFNITLPDNFPSEDIPVITFTPPIYHPAVDPTTGLLNLKEIFPLWDKKRNHIWQILKYVNWIFMNLNMKVPLNADAAQMYKTNIKQFMEKAKESVMNSIDHLYDEPPTDDKHYITFSPYDENIHDTAVATMMERPTPPNVKPMSWVQPDSFKPFSKKDAA